MPVGEREFTAAQRKAQYAKELERQQADKAMRERQERERSREAARQDQGSMSMVPHPLFCWSHGFRCAAVLANDDSQAARRRQQEYAAELERQIAEKKRQGKRQEHELPGGGGSKLLDSISLRVKPPHPAFVGGIQLCWGTTMTAPDANGSMQQI